MNFLTTPEAHLAPADSAMSAEAFEALYREHWPAVVDYLRFRVGPADAADVAADAFAHAWKARGQYDPSRGVAAGWLWAIARNTANAWFRGRPRAAESLAEGLAMDASLVDLAARAESMARVAVAVGRLGVIDQEIIALRFGGGLPYRDIGDAVGLTENATTARLHRAIRRLRIALEGSEVP